MNDGVFTWIRGEFGLTVVTSMLVLACAWSAATSGARLESLSRAARVSALLMAAIAGLSSASVWLRGHDWQHLQWSLGCPMLGLFFVSGPFLATPHLAPRQATAERRRSLRCGSWVSIPIVLFVLAVISIGVIAASPRELPTTRTSPGPLAGIAQIAAYGLGLHDLPPVLAIVHPWDGERGMGHLTRDITVPFSVLTLAARLILGYVALSFALHAAPSATVRRALAFVAPMLATALLGWPLLATPMDGYWQIEPEDVRRFGPTLLAAALALAVLAGFERRAQRRDLERSDDATAPARDAATPAPSPTRAPPRAE